MPYKSIVRVAKIKGGGKGVVLANAQPAAI
jgi:hypothetical protein